MDTRANSKSWDKEEEIGAKRNDLNDETSLLKQTPDVH